MKRVFNSCFLVLVIVIFASTSFAAEWGEQKVATPVLITSVGQSPDALMVKVLLKRLKLDFTYDNMAKADVVGQFKSIIMVVGFSGKGLGAAQISKKDEIERAERLLDEAKAKNVTVVMAHIGGKARLGAGSNHLVDMVASKSDYLVYVSDAEVEPVFRKMIDKYNLPAKSAPKISSTASVFKELYQ
ncbi:hypothetical protein KJ966_08230 [bacterium]|nr:hypothetical protein [bacterium]